MDKLTTAACNEAVLFSTALASFVVNCCDEENDKANGNVVDVTLAGGCSERGDGDLEHLVGVGDSEGDIDADGDREFDDDEVDGIGEGSGDGNNTPLPATLFTLWLWAATAAAIKLILS